MKALTLGAVWRKLGGISSLEEVAHVLPLERKSAAAIKRR
jgi:hypothetical protein